MLKIFKNKKTKLPAFTFKRGMLYFDIDEIPQYNWEKINMAGDLSYLIIDDKLRKKGLPITKTRLEESYFTLHDQYSEITGNSDKVQEWRILVLARMEMRVRYANGDKSRINFINEYDEMIKDLMEDGKDVDLIENRLIVQQLYGQSIDTKTISAGEYARISKLVEKQNQPKNTADGN